MGTGTGNDVSKKVTAQATSDWFIVRLSCVSDIAVLDSRSWLNVNLLLLLSLVTI